MFSMFKAIAALWALFIGLLLTCAAMSAVTVLLTMSSTIANIAGVICLAVYVTAVVLIGYLLRRLLTYVPTTSEDPVAGSPTL
jgi:hypothetical protein